MDQQPKITGNPDLDLMPRKPAGIVAWGYKYSPIVILVVCVLVAFGVYSLDIMNKNEFPTYTITEGVFAAAYPGATAEQVSEEVLKPMEDYVFSFKEVKKSKTHSQVSDGTAIIYVELNDDVKNTEEFWNKFRGGVDALKLTLPPGVLGTEVISDFGATSALLITMSSDQKNYRELHNLMDDLKSRLRPINSIGRMAVSGEQKEQIAVYINQEKLANYPIGGKEIALALASQGFNTTAGNLQTPKYTVPITVKRLVNSVKEVESQVIMALPDGRTIKVGDVADVRMEYPEPSSFVTNNGQKSLVLSIEMKEGYNVVALGNEVQKELKDYEKTLPDSVTLFTITNQPENVNASVMDFLSELLIAVIGVLIAIILLLPMRVALIAASTIPITIFISLGFFYAFGIELNTVTLACLIVSLGMIVDNSVVILDEYVDLLRLGIDRKTATLASATEFFKAIISATMAISITFFPFLLTTTGMMHDFLLDFPWAITLILFISLIVAEMLVPLMQYYFIKPEKVIDAEEGIGKNGKKHVTALLLLQKGYDKLITVCFAWPKTVIAIGLISVVLGVWLLINRPMQLMPDCDRNQFAVEITLPAGTRLERTSEVADSMAAILRKDPRVVSVAIFHGCSSPRFQTTYAPKVGGPDYAQFIVNTTSNKTTVEVLNEYTPKYRDYFPDARILFKQLSYQEAANPIELRVSGPDLKVLRELSDSLLGIMRGIDGLTLVNSTLREPRLVAEVDPDEDNMALLGLNSGLVQLTLATRYTSGVQVATVWEGDYGIPVVAKSYTGDASDISDLQNERMPLLGSQNVPLSQFAKVQPKYTLGQIDHWNGIPAVTVQAQIDRKLNAIDMTKKVQKAIKDFKLPKGYSIYYAGVWENTFDTLPEIMSALILAVVIIFFILLMHYKQVGLSALLVGCLVLCIPGMAFGLILGRSVFSLTCTLGLISLMGILVRNAIIMLDYAEKLRTIEGQSARDAAINSAKRRMRPIFLTSAAASMGVVPMMLGNSSLWQPMGAVIFWGTIITMIYILTFIPVAYWKTRKEPKKPAPAPVATTGQSEQNLPAIPDSTSNSTHNETTE